MSSTSLPSMSSPDSEATAKAPTGVSDFQDSSDFYRSSGTLAFPEHDGTVQEKAGRDLLAFYRHGRDVGERADSEGLLPISLHQYVNASVRRGRYPLCIGDDPDDIPTSLTSIIDQLIGTDLPPDDDEGKERVRLLLRVDRTIRQLFTDNSDLPLLRLWDLAVEQVMSQNGATTPSTTREILKEARGRLRVDGKMVGFSHDSLVPTVGALNNRIWQRRFSEVQTEAARLALQVDDLLRVDFGESDESRTPDHLQASVGKTFAAELDFEALSGIMSESRAHHRMPVGRRRRLESVQQDLENLPKILSAEGAERVLNGQAGIEAAPGNVRRDLETIARLSRAAQVAQLEITGKYVEDQHDAFFEAFGVADLTDEEIEMCPPCLIDAGPSSQLTASGRGLLTDLLASRMPVKVILRIDDLGAGVTDLAGEDPPSAAAHAAWQATMLGTAYVFQAPLSEGEAIGRAARACAEYPGPALLSVYTGVESTTDLVDEYLGSAMALESRAFPMFEFKPTGKNWADRFSAEGNPTATQPWGSTDVEVDRDGEMVAMTVSFTFADFLFCDLQHRQHFRAVGPEMWHESMTPIDEYTRSGDDTESNLIPFLWAADQDGYLHRIVPTRRVVEATRFAFNRWRTLQEMSGINSSLAALAVEESEKRFEQEKQQALAEVHSQYEAELQKTTGELARGIVSNIAAGLLGLQAAGSPPANLSGRPLEAPAASIDESAGSAAQSESSGATKDPGADADAATSSNEDDEEVIALDDPYVETARCTTCNECTNINPRLFAYDDNQQAYIKDATAGTYRELVTAAEKCPVRIIHPGRPLNPEEPDLGELMERAKPYM